LELIYERNFLEKVFFSTREPRIGFGWSRFRKGNGVKCCNISREKAFMSENPGGRNTETALLFQITMNYPVSS
jgi:hypothetical protein